MLHLTLKRSFLGDRYTIGHLYINGKYFCDTLEDKVRDTNKNGRFDGLERKIYAETAIPYGAYKVILAPSPKYGRIMPRLLDVPNFEGILIHWGNTPKDTMGCILVGENKIKGQVINSRKAFNKLYDVLKLHKDIVISIE